MLGAGGGVAPRTFRTATRLPVALGAAAFALFAATAARTITFWDGAHYPLLATTLSISNPPGSLLLTVLGWLWTRLHWSSSPAFQLNLLAAACAGCTIALIARVALLTSAPDGEARGVAWLAGAAAAGWLATAYHLWTYATQFTPYGLTATFTALLLALFVRWWQRAEGADDLPGLLVFALVMGLDVSVHRTNQLLIPAALVGVWLRRPRLFLDPRGVVLALLAYGAGVATQAGYLVLSARRPFMDLAEMHSLVDVWHYVRLDAMGGGFLVGLWPRRADFLHVQLADWLGFLWRSMGGTALPRAVALALACTGLAGLARRAWRMALFLLASFVSAGLGAVVFFNRPEQYMRPLDRHYLPSLVVLAVFVGAGAAELARLARDRKLGFVRVLPALGIATLVAANLVANLASCDRSHTRYAERWARDLLEPLPPNAVLFTNGDNDSFPLWYMQQAEHVRPDVMVLNLPILCLPGPARRFVEREPALRDIEGSPHAMQDILRAIARRRPVYAAVTVSPGWEPDVLPPEVLEGLSNRLYLAGEQPVTGRELEHFVCSRLPLLHADDHRQLLELDAQLMLSNYASAALALASRQIRQGEFGRTLETLRFIETHLPPARFGDSGRATQDEITKLRRSTEEAQRAQQAAKSR